MNQTELKQVKRLLVLADAAADFEHVDITLVTHFHVMREELGLAKLLLLIQEYVEHKTQSRPDAQVSEGDQPNKVSVQ
jgi:hypothetical protein